MHSHEEAEGGGISILLRINNVEIVLGEESRDGMNDTWTIRAGKGKDVFICFNHLD